VPGSIQSIERAAAVLRLLASTDRPLGLAELAAALDLPRPTVHGIVRTPRDVEFVVQEAGGSRYRLAQALHGLGAGGLDQHDLRAGAMNWADALAGGTGLAVQVGAVAGRCVRLVHHVFRPDGSPQRLRIGEELPLHATALGKCLLAFAPVATPPVRDLELTRWTGRTCTSVAALDAHLAAARQRGWASELGEYQAGVGAASAPLRVSGGTVVGALGVHGPVEELFGVGGELRRPIAEQLVADAREVSAALQQAQAAHVPVERRV
jgi:DNA-binding IclR family transcriptional regulator